VLVLFQEELMTSISRKLEILRAEQDDIRDEVKTNSELGAEITLKVEQGAKPQVK